MASFIKNQVNKLWKQTKDNVIIAVRPKVSNLVGKTISEKIFSTDKAVEQEVARKQVEEKRKRESRNMKLFVVSVYFVILLSLSAILLTSGQSDAEDSNQLSQVRKNAKILAKIVFRIFQFSFSPGN